MGIESRDWYREESRRAASRALGRREAAVVVCVLVALGLAVSPFVRERLGYELPLGLETVFRNDTTPGALRIEPVPGGPSIEILEPRLYPRSERWAPWLASEAVCPRGEDSSAPQRVQVQVLLCLTNFARAREGLAPLRLSPVLSSAASAKAADIVRCGDFAHEACGRPVDEAARLRGHRSAFGENLYIAERPLVAPRMALDAWLNSEGHRENLFRPEWRVMGAALVADADVGRFRDGVVWVQQFGT